MSSNEQANEQAKEQAEQTEAEGQAKQATLSPAYVNRRKKLAVLANTVAKRKPRKLTLMGRWKLFRTMTLVPLLVSVSIGALSWLVWAIEGTSEQYYEALASKIYCDCYDRMKEMGMRERQAFITWHRPRIRAAIGVVRTEEMFSQILRRLHWEDMY